MKPEERKLMIQMSKSIVDLDKRISKLEKIETKPVVISPYTPEEKMTFDENLLDPRNHIVIELDSSIQLVTEEMNKAVLMKYADLMANFCQQNNVKMMKVIFNKQ